MKKRITRTLALALAAVLSLSACSAGNNTTDNTTANNTNTPATTTPATTTPSNQTTTSEAPAVVETNAKPITDLVYPRLETREPLTFNILYSQSASDYETLTNLVDGLLELDPYGALQPGLAESWGTEDGKVWTFNIRKGVSWVDMNGNPKADVTAWDWATGLEWVLNFHKNDSVNTSMPIEMIEGAQEYYDYTKALDMDAAYALTGEAGSKFMEMVGMEIPDDYTLIYTCTTPKAYFDTVATYSCLYPMSAKMIEVLGGIDKTKAMNNTDMWYNGCYTLTSYIQKNEKTFTANPLYWDQNCDLFDTVTNLMVESNDVAYQLFQSGEIDYVTLTESNVKTISSDPNHKYYDYLVPDVFSKYSYQVHFNFNKMNEDDTEDTNWNTALANESFRLAWYYGINFLEFFKRTNTLTPMVCENNFYTMKGLCYTTDGTDYVELVRDELGLGKENGEVMVRLDESKAAAYKAQAIEELTALGVEFPILCDYYISSSSSTALDTANVLSQVFSEYLGDDFVKLNIKTFISSSTTEVYVPGYHSIAINGWGADYGDPQNYLGQEIYGYDNAYYSQRYSRINKVEVTDATKDLIAVYKEFTRLVEAADAITDNQDARYAAYAKAEAYMIEHAIIVPCYYSVGWALAKVDNSSRILGMYGAQNDKMKNWKTSVDGYTTEQAAALKAAKEAK